MFEFDTSAVLCVCVHQVVLLRVQDCLQPLSMQALPAQPESLCIVEMGGVEKQDELGEKGTMGFLYLNIGLQVPAGFSGTAGVVEAPLFIAVIFQNGVLLRTVLDPVTGDLSDTRTRYLGSRPVKLFRVRMQGQEAVRLPPFCITSMDRVPEFLVLLAGPNAVL